jgi:3D (Asp-Asp-Asp) domain-containing protein
MTVQIKRGMDINVIIDGVSEIRRTPADLNVGQLQTFLQSEKNIALLYAGDAERSLNDGDAAVFTTWQGELHTITETIPYETIENKTAAIRNGTTYVRQEGVSGEQEITTAVVKIGGKERERQVTDVKLVSEPVDEIIDIGVGGALGTRTDTSAPDFYYRDKMLMNASAYTAGFGCTGKNPGDPGYGVTASGRLVQPGIASVDPTVIPLGTNLYVEGYGFSVAADVGSAIKGHKIDLFHYELEDALRFGRRDLMVYVLE